MRVEVVRAGIALRFGGDILLGFFEFDGGWFDAFGFSGTEHGFDDGGGPTADWLAETATKHINHAIWPTRSWGEIDDIGRFDSAGKKEESHIADHLA